MFDFKWVWKSENYVYEFNFLMFSYFYIKMYFLSYLLKHCIFLVTVLELRNLVSFLSFYCLLSLRRVFISSSTIPIIKKPSIYNIFFFLLGLLFRWKHLSQVWIFLLSSTTIWVAFLFYKIFSQTTCLATFSCCCCWRTNIIFLFYYIIDDDLDQC